MELNEALKVVLELAEQNMLNDPEMQDEMLRQMNAIESVRAHMQELENPSPIQVMLFTHGGVIHDSISNVPVHIAILGEDIEGGGHITTLSSEDDTSYVVEHAITYCEPQRVAAILSETIN